MSAWWWACEKCGYLYGEDAGMSGFVRSLYPAHLHDCVQALPVRIPPAIAAALRRAADAEKRTEIAVQNFDHLADAYAAALRERDAWRDDYREAIRHIPFAPAAPKAHDVHNEACGCLPTPKAITFRTRRAEGGGAMKPMLTDWCEHRGGLVGGGRSNTRHRKHCFDAGYELGFMRGQNAAAEMRDLLTEAVATEALKPYQVWEKIKSFLFLTAPAAPKEKP